MELISINDEQYIELLIDGAMISPEEKKLLYSENSSGLDYERFNELRAYLWNAQQPPVTHSLITSMKDITNAIKMII
jgi:hypothetical protein